ncbi:MAG TPA: BTAD domain-containing putative transcriptional regulator [Fimbriimonadaceae bacterium]
MRLSVGGEPIDAVNTNRLQALLAAITLHPGSPQSRASLALNLWPESGDAQARTNLRQLIYHLRRALPSECENVVYDNHFVCWQGGSVDASEFEAALEQGIKFEKSKDSQRAKEQLGLAVELYKDDLLPDLNDEWLVIPREQLREGYLEALIRLARFKEAEGDLDGAIRDSAKLLALDPLRETTYLSLMRMNMLNGNKAAALRIYHQCLRTLRRELGALPCREVEDLYEKALKTDEAPSAVPLRDATAPGSRYPLIGRKTELESVRSFLQSQLGTRFILITGEPGIGKSRFAEELARPHLGAQIASANCYFGQGRIAFGPLAELLRSSAFQPFLSGVSKVRLIELARVLPELLAEDVELARPQTITEGWQKLHFFDAVHAAIQTAPRPLILLLEDLHWCDADTLDWLASMFRARLSGDVLVIGTARLGELDRSHPLIALRHEMRLSDNYLEIGLQPLEYTEVFTLTSQIMGTECQSHYAESIYKATKGNPLFVVETVRAALEVNSGDGIPARLQAVIEQRLGHISPEAFELTEFASMFGGPFTSELLALAADWDEASVARPLDELGRRSIIELTQEGEYDFTHALLREVAHRGISPIRRRSLDFKIARALEELYGMDSCPASIRIASHYESAGKADRAIPHYRNAAVLAQGRFAESEALELLEHAVSLCHNLPSSTERDTQELELLAMLGPSLVVVKGYSASSVGEIYEKGLLLARKTGNTSHAFALSSGAWIFHIVRGDIRESADIAFQCLDQVRREQAIERASNLLLGISLFHLGEFSESRTRIEYANFARGEPPHPALTLFAGRDVGVFCRSYLSQLLWHEGKPNESAEVSAETVALGRESAHPFSLALALDYAALLTSFKRTPSAR